MFVFATEHWVNLNVRHLWLCFTQVDLLEVGVSRLNSCHVLEEVHKMFTSVPLPEQLTVRWGIFQGHAEQHSYSCMVIKCKRLPIGLWQQQRFLSLPDFRPRFQNTFCLAVQDCSLNIKAGATVGFGSVMQQELIWLCRIQLIFPDSENCPSIITSEFPIWFLVFPKSTFKRYNIQGAVRYCT